MRVFARLSVFIVFFCLALSPSSAQETPNTPQPDGTLRRIDVPILMYHYVSPLPADADDIRINLTVEPYLFRTHLEYLREAGYETISLNQLYEALNQGTPLPPKPIILTFDDGHIDHYQVVFPLLREFGFTGTFFIITGRADANDPAHLNWQQITEMANAGMSMEAHSKSHLDLRGRDRDFLIYEILGSMESLEAHTNKTVSMFAYPAGQYDDMTIEIADETGIEIAVTTQNGRLQTTSDTLYLPRLRITGNMGRFGLENLLGG